MAQSRVKPGVCDLPDGLDSPINSGLKLLAHSLFSLSMELGLRLDVFSHGPVSVMIGEEPRHAARLLICTLNLHHFKNH